MIIIKDWANVVITATEELISLSSHLKLNARLIGLLGWKDMVHITWGNSLVLQNINFNFILRPIHFTIVQNSVDTKNIKCIFIELF